VPIQPDGERRPFFWVHPVGGNVFCYAELASALGRQQPFYGLQSPGPEEVPLHRIEDMASRYLAALREAQAVGPYRLGGWSMGGVVAYEMARQLAQQGEEVELLALLDARPASGEPLQELAETDLVSLFANDLIRTAGLGLSVEAEALREAAPDDPLGFIFGRARELGLLPPGFDLSRFHGLYETFRTNLRALRTYSPGPYPGRLALFAATEGAVVGQADSTLGWGRFAAEVQVEAVSGDHYGVVRRPVVEEIASRLTQSLDEIAAEEQGAVS